MKLLRAFSWRNVFLLLCALIAFFVGGMSVGGYFSRKALHTSDKYRGILMLDRRSNGVRFTSPLLECAESNPLPILQLRELEAHVTDYIEGKKEQVHMSMYFRDLNNGGWIQVGDEGIYQPASLMKLPIVIAAFKKLEQDETFFDTRVVVEDGGDIQQNIITGPETKQNEVLSVRELVYRTVVYSDNKASATLIGVMGFDLIEKVLHDFGVPSVTTVEDYQVNPRIYSSFFRILYNATYLSQDHSEDALKYLSESKFDKGLRLGVPKSVKIAHKFGERIMQGDTSSFKYQLHDCGIVYAKRPYVLCVMSRGNSFESLNEAIGDVSRVTYEYMAKQ